MATLKCKMCGGTLEIIDNQTVCECEYCGSKQTLPKLVDENLQALFNRANTLRMKAEFDKAAEIYEKILQADGTEAEAYWGLILCKYGIEYVEDPKTYKRIPTCHRASYDAVTSDDDYKMAIQYADVLQRSVYESDAKQIDEIQKGIVLLAQNEETYDIFICYKESDENGSRTIDSVVANDIYYQLVNEGYKVFYAAITLEDKLGQEYEPFIFSALNSAKVMLVIGTKTEYFNAVWVKNEWSRFLKIMKRDRGRMLIPCYKDMDAYEMPEEFAHLQAQDMSKIGFINDVVRGIKKVIKKEDNTKENVIIQQTTNNNSQALVRRGYMSLEDEEWDKADGFFEEVLNQNPECAEAYMGKFLASLKRKNIEELVDYCKNKYTSKIPVKNIEACPEDYEHISRIVEQYKLEGFLDASTIKKMYEGGRFYKSEFEGCVNNEEEALKFINNEKLFLRTKQYATEEYKQTIEGIIVQITDFFAKKKSECKEKDEKNREQAIENYKKYLSEVDKKIQEEHDDWLNKRESFYQDEIKYFENAKSIYEYEEAKKHFEKVATYKNSADYIQKCETEIIRINRECEEEQQRREEQERITQIEKEESVKKRKRKIAIIASVVGSFLVILYINLSIIPQNKYNKAIALKNNEQYEAAIAAFENLNGYKDAEQQIQLCYEKINDKLYNSAIQLKNEGQYEAAIDIFRDLSLYKDARQQVEMCIFQQKMQIIQQKQRGDIIQFGNYEWQILTKDDNKALLITTTIVESRKYNDIRTDITWEKCALRKWLNGEFYNDFDDFEKSHIIYASLENNNNPKYGTKGGNATDDKVFLLSIEEVDTYMDEDNRGIEFMWMLRSPGLSNNTVACVDKKGSIHEDGYAVDSPMYVRPAIWISFKN